MNRTQTNHRVKPAPDPATRGSEDLWLGAAYEVLVTAGVDAVKVMPLAHMLGLSRTSFYWHFKDREALLSALLDRWETQNTGNLVARTEAYADSINEALYNLFDCWLTRELFDSRLDFAIRNWALGDPVVKAKLQRTDETRITAIRAMFARFGYAPDHADTRAHTVYYTQIGYISMMVAEPRDIRIARMPAYVENFSGHAPAPAETARFMARHTGS
jgi:AcrR family transcriptional regulator